MMSKRQEIAVRLGSLVSAMKMITPVGGYLGQAECSGKPHVVGISKPRNLDGTIYVFSPDHITVSLQSRYSGMSSFRATYGSEAAVGLFLTYLHHHEFDEAVNVRRKR